jgi:hypothetical protein
MRRRDKALRTLAAEITPNLAARGKTGRGYHPPARFVVVLQTLFTATGNPHMLTVEEGLAL